MMISLRLTFRAVFFSVLVPAVLAAGPGLSVTNPATVGRVNEPVVVAWTSVEAAFPGVRPTGLRVMDEEGNDLTVQVDDLDGNGSPDELVFAIDIGPESTRKFRLQSGGPEPASSPQARTDAGNWKRVDGHLTAVMDDDLAGTGRDRKAYRFDGVGWESELIAYRLYLDGRNAVDIQGKRKPGLYWNWIGGSEVDYQLDAEWGMDVLHVGPALGVGGIGFWVGDSVLKPLTVERQRCRILARGPVRAVVRVDYTGWDTGTGKADITSLFTLMAGERITEHRITSSASSPPLTLVTGIVRHDSTTVEWNPDAAWLRTWGHQSRANDTLQMAIAVDPASVTGSTADTSNHLLLLPLRPGHSVRLLISALWQGESRGPWDEGRARTLVEESARRLRTPLGVSLYDQ